jgi:hypothetical protein
MVASAGSAEGVPSLINYQGRLTDVLGEPVPNGTILVEFALYPDSLGGTPLWTESAEVVTVDGLFSHLLGSTSPLLPAVFSGDSVLYLEVSAEGQPPSHRTRLTSVPYSRLAGGLLGRDSSGVRSLEALPDEHRLILFDGSGDAGVVLRADTVGDSAVVLPEASVSSEELLNEPGLVTYIQIYPITLVDMEMTDLVTVEIETPADGYIVLEGKCYVEMSGTTGPNVALVQIDENEGGGSSFPYYSLAGLGGYVNTSSHYFPIYLRRIYWKKAGSYEFRMEGRASYPPPATARTWDHVLTASYYPTNYGPVYQIVTDPTGFDQPRALPMSDPVNPDASGTFYEVDLRELEAKAADDAAD